MDDKKILLILKIALFALGLIAAVVIGVAVIGAL